MSDWLNHELRAIARYRDGENRLGSRVAEPRERQLTQLGNAAWAAGLALLMQGSREAAVEWLKRAVERYQDSYADASPDSWGRPVAVLKACLLIGERPLIRDAAGWALGTGCADAPSPIARYAACLALLALGRGDEAGVHAAVLQADGGFPRPVADALAALAHVDAAAYRIAIKQVLTSFEERTEFLEDVPVADTVLVLQALAVRRSFEARLVSPLLPG